MTSLPHPGASRLSLSLKGRGEVFPSSLEGEGNAQRSGARERGGASAALAQSHRLAGGSIDRARPLGFSFDGRAYSGFAGDTLASALVANGVKLVARSFKYHRPRGILTAGAEEPNALVSVMVDGQRDPNTRATTLELTDGLEAVSQNRWPSLGFDMGAVNGLFAPLLKAGFYYKTFTWPAAFWERVYEPLIRRAAGIGALDGRADASAYDRAHAFADLLVIGAGSAGLAAALAAGRSGARVIVVDEDSLPGGRLNAERDEVDGQPGHVWAAAAAAELALLPNVRLLTRTTLFGVYDSHVHGAVEALAPTIAPCSGPRLRYWKIVAPRTLLATGAVERPIVFGGNDRPGVMMASAVRAYVNRWAATPGHRVALFTTTDDGWRTAADLAAAGVEIAAVIDARDIAPPSVTGARVFTRAHVVATHGRAALRSIEVRDADGRTHSIAADALAVSGGWNPAIGLGAHLGHRPRWSDAVHSFVLDQTPPGMTAIGAAAGGFALPHALSDGVALGLAVAADAGRTPARMTVPRSSEDATGGVPQWHVPGSRGPAFVDHQHDVTTADLGLAAAEGMTSIEHLKRYTTLGMATDQGKLANVNGHALIAALTGRPIAQAGTVLSRPPDRPVPIGAFAGNHRGEHFRPVRLPPSHGWAAERGASFVDVGQWKRAQWFARGGEDWRASVAREVAAVRGDVGVCDVSTLGKIDVRGRDAAAFLDRVYANTMSTVAVGRARYGLMLREDGHVFDDGTAARLADDHYYLTTTTANAGRVMQHLEYARQILWPSLDVRLASTTDQWAQYALAGPRSRALLGDAADVSDAALPYMGVAAFRWRGLPTRLFRLSFSGERAYEIAVPSAYGDALIRAVEALGATPYGTEALGVMRIEKGHAAGNELDGRTTAADLGLGKMLSTKKDFIGRAMAAREGLTDPARPRLMGFVPVDRAQPLRAGAHLLAVGAPAIAANDEGWLSSAVHSPTLGHAIALGFFAHGAERVRAYDPVRGGDTLCEVVPPVFVDPEGARLRG